MSDSKSPSAQARDDLRLLIVCDTQFGWNGGTTLKLEEIERLVAREWLAEGDNFEYDVTDAGRAVIDSALTPAPQVPGDMALCNAILRHQFQDEHRGGRLTVDVETLLHDYNAHKATPPLNELLGQPKEFNLNEVSGNSGQLASLELRARERLPALARTHEGQKLYSLAYARGRLKGRQDAAVDLGVIGSAEQPALGDRQDKALAWDAVCIALNTYTPGWANSEEKTGLQSAVAAIAALSAQPHGVDDPIDGDWYTDQGTGARVVDWDDKPESQFSLMLSRDGKVRYSAFIDGISITGADAKSDHFIETVRRWANAAAPQPREVPGDVWGRLEKWLGAYADSIPTAAYHELVSIQRATTPQDAAGVDSAPYCYEVRWIDGVTTYPATLPAFTGNALVTPLYTTPSPGVDVGKLREFVDGLRRDASGGEGYNYTAYEEGRIAEKRHCAHRLAEIIDAAAPGVQAND
jgi:hypothetical protein